jgi:hypothetical protein
MASHALGNGRVGRIALAVPPDHIQQFLADLDVIGRQAAHAAMRANEELTPRLFLAVQRPTRAVAVN